jgi:RNA polymerase sigma-70 factor (ECF subfamily)
MQDSLPATIANETDLRLFYERTFDEVHRYARRLAGADRQGAEDLVRDAYVALVRAVRSRSIDAPTVAWLITAVRNRFIDRVRRERVSANRASPAPAVDADDGPAVPALVRLQPLERAVLVLHHIERFSVAEVAEVIGMSTLATESLLARARSAMRRLLHEGVGQ